MNGKYKIIVVDDHRIFREGLVFVISRMKDFEVIGEASNGEIFLEMIENMEPDVILMDISMPVIDGTEATTRAIRKYPDLKIIALTMFSDKEFFNKMVQAGVSGFLLKESGKEELEKALYAVISGEKYYSQKLIHNIILNSNITNQPIKRIPSPRVNLTNIESEILKSICLGLSAIQISENLSLSLRSIEGYKADLMSKTGTKNTINLAVFALKNKLVDI
jgi:DNA-binding NarL/FixJ family response regulator